MHEHGGFFCKSVNPWKLIKSQLRKKKKIWAKTGVDWASHWALRPAWREGCRRGDGPWRWRGGSPGAGTRSTQASRGAGCVRLLLLDAGAGEAGDGAKTGEGSGEDRPEGTGTAGSGESGHGNGAPAARQGTRRGAESWRTTTSGAGHSDPQDRDEARGSSSSSSSRITRGDEGGMRLEIPAEEAGVGDELEAVHGVRRHGPHSLQADDDGRAR